MDPAKVSAVAEWPTPDSRKKVQQFLGLANLCQGLQCNSCSSSCSYFHSGTISLVSRGREGVPEPQASLHHGSHPHSARPTAPICGGGGCVQRRSRSSAIPAVERNFDVGNQELLAVELLTLEEWRHWLEGAEQPFIVWTDHKNLEFIRKAKRLNSRQARWALFFNRFFFYALLQVGIPKHQTRCLVMLI